MLHPAVPAAVLALGLASPLAAQNLPEFSWGAAVTSDYISKGSTQSDGHPAVQGYVEGAYNIFYGGVWSSTVSFPGDEVFGNDNLEIDLYAGVRPTFGDLSADVSYVRYFYDDSGDCCGEFVFVLGYPMADIGEVGAELDYDPEADTKWGVLSASVSFLTDFSVGGTLGTDFGTFDLGDNKVAWDLGVTRALGDFAEVDLRYYDANDEPARGVLSVAVDF